VIPGQTLDSKITELTARIEKGDLDEQDRALAEDLLKTYENLKSATGEGSWHEDPNEIIRMLYNQMAQLDRQYFSKTATPSISKDTLEAFMKERKKIMDTYLAGDKQGVVNGCLDLEARYGHHALTPDMGLLFALSLGERGYKKEAVNIGQKVMEQMEGQPDLVHLRSSLVAWNLDLGERKGAMEAYHKLDDDVSERDALLKRTAGMIKKRQQEPIDKGKQPAPAEPSPLPESAHGLSIDVLLKRVDELVKIHAYDEAKLLLLQYRIRVQDGPELETIDQALQSVETAQSLYDTERFKKEKREKEIILLVHEQIEKEEYAEAIEALDRFAGLQDMTKETLSLRETAVKKLVNKERNRAARFFLMAKRTREPSKRETYLLSSYHILKGLIEKYPSSPLIEKLNSHLQKVKTEMDKYGVEPG
jgi:hypothetical protein